MNIKHLIISALLLSSSSIIQADTIGWGNRPGNPNRPPIEPSRPIPIDPPIGSVGPTDPWGNSGGWGQSQSHIIEENVQQYFMGQSRFDLLLDHYIRSQLFGLKILDVTVIASTEMGQGRATLLLNGQSIESSKIVSRQMSSYTFRVDQFANSVGHSLRTIELAMQGRFFVDKIIFNTFEDSGPTFPGNHHPGPNRPPEGPQSEIVRQLVNQRIEQEGGLELSRLFNLGLERQGQVIRRVNVLARSARGFGQASLLVNGQQIDSSQSISSMTSQISFSLNQGMRIGSEIQGLRLVFRGDIVIEEVSLEIEQQRGGGRSPLPVERRFEQNVNRRIYGANQSDLRNLMQIPSRFDGALVDSVELTLRNSDMGVRIKLCEITQGRFQTMNCGVQAITSTGFQVIRLSSLSSSDLRNLSIDSRFGMIDIDKIAINFR